MYWDFGIDGRTAIMAIMELNDLESLTTDIVVWQSLKKNN